jgi:hypothetical protein
MIARTPGQLTETEFARAVLLRQQGGSVAPLARELGVVPDSLRRAVRSALGAVEGCGIPEELVDLNQRVAYDRTIERYKAEASQYRKLYQHSIRVASTQDMLVDSMREHVLVLPASRPASITKPHQEVSGTHTAVLQASDWHVGETVDREVMGGLGEYSVEIFRQRMGLMVERLLDLVDLRRSRLWIPKLVILLDGDCVSGDYLHDELTRTNEGNMIKQMTTAALVGSHVVGQLSQHFEEVEVSCTVGNHGRNQRKPENKDTYVNWDYLAYELMAMLLRGHENVKFDIPKSKWQITRIESVSFLHFHGDGIKGWAGFPWYGVSRAIKALRESLMVGEHHFDAVAMGHFHVPNRYESPTGPWFVNGCVKGADEFSLNALHTTVRPIQNLFFVHSSRGVLGDEPLFLDGNLPKHAESVPTDITDVWADQKI